MEAKHFKKSLKVVFDRLEASEPSVRRGIVRQLIEKITVYRKNKVEIRWRVLCDTGGGMFDFDKEWGGQWGLNPRVSESQSDALTTSPWPP